MIPERSGIEVTSTVQGEDFRMGIDTEALAHIMNVLTDLYADPELAVVREYSTNAFDAHVQAGIRRAIEVSTPSDLRPVFSVRDYGAGLDRLDIETIYSRYGASTKRASNDAVGMLGLGCKSALAYVDQFNLTGWKDGIRTAVSISRAEDGTGTMTILEQTPSDEPSGVLVSVPVKRGNKLSQKAADFFRFWTPGTVLVDSKQPDPLEGYELTHDLTIIDRDAAYNSSDPLLHVVMGNVAYPADDFTGDWLSLPRSKALVARVPIGSVQFAPSREALQDTAVTKRAMSDLAETFAAAAQAAVQRDVDAADSRGKAIQAAQAAASSLGIQPRATWRGEQVPMKVGYPEANTTGVKDDSVNVRKIRWVPGGYRYGRSGGSFNQHVNIESALGAIWVTNFDNENFSADMRRKLLRYAAVELGDSGVSRDIALVAGPDLPCADWLSECDVADWSVVRKWRDPDKPTVSGPAKPKGTYPVLSNLHRYADDRKAEDFPSENLYYVEGRKYNQGWAVSALEATGLKTFTVVILARPRVAKFKRDFPEAKAVNTVLAERATKWWKRLSKQSRAVIAAKRSGALNGPSVIRELDPERVDDPELRASIELTNGWTTALSAAYETYRQYLSGVKLDGTVPVRPEAVAKRYPLLPRYLSGSKAQRDHTYLYVNAVYAANKKEGQ